jgi:hypothetical protein
VCPLLGRKRKMKLGWSSELPSLRAGVFLSGSAATAAFDSSLVLGAEYDRRLLAGRRASVYRGVDFLASPLDVKLSNPSSDVSGQYAYVFLTPHVRVKFNPDGRLSPWLLFGGGYARFLEKKPTAEPPFEPSRSGKCSIAARLDCGRMTSKPG